MGRARASNDDLVFTKFTAAALAEGGGAKAINLADGIGTGSRVGQSPVVRTSNPVHDKPMLFPLSGRYAVALALQ